MTDVEACPICNAEGPCGYDDAGQPWVHTDAFEARS